MDQIVNQRLKSSSTSSDPSLASISFSLHFGVFRLVQARAALPPYPVTVGELGINTHSDRFKRSPPRLPRFQPLQTYQSSPLSPSFVAPQALKPILDSNHQNLWEKAANFDWRADPLIPNVKKSFWFTFDRQL